MPTGWLWLVACQGAVDPTVPSCARTWQATATSLRALFAEAGRPVPDIVGRRTWVARCEALALSDAQLVCLEPEAAAADPAGCRAVLEPIASARAELDGLFLSALGIGEGVR